MSEITEIVTDERVKTLEARIATLEDILTREQKVERIRVGDKWFEMKEGEDLVAKAMIGEFGKMNKKISDALKLIDTECVKNEDFVEAKKMLGQFDRIVEKTAKIAVIAPAIEKECADNKKQLADLGDDLDHIIEVVKKILDTPLMRIQCWLLKLVGGHGHE